VFLKHGLTPSSWNNGMLELWNIGFWEFGRVVFLGKIHYKKIEKLDIYLLSHYSIIPLFLPRETHFYFTGANIPIGAEPLSSSLRLEPFAFRHFETSNGPFIGNDLIGVILIMISLVYIPGP
jgi:hypothetical protein